MMPADAIDGSPGHEITHEYHDMLGMRLDYLPAEQFVKAFVDRALNGPSAYCCVPDVFQCMICHDNERHRAIVNGATYVMSDSTILQTARALRHGVPRIKTELGTRLMLALCAEASDKGVPIALIGGRDNDVLARIERSLKEQFEGLKVAYSFSPPFRPLQQDEEATMLRELLDSDARLVFIGIGCPKQEQWMSRYEDRFTGAMIGVGAAFDAIGGTVKTAPAAVHALGLEWLFRLAREPRRLWRRYFISAPRFLLLLGTDWISSTLRGNAQPGS